MNRETGYELLNKAFIETEKGEEEMKNSIEKTPVPMEPAEFEVPMETVYDKLDEIERRFKCAENNLRNCQTFIDGEEREVPNMIVDRCIEGKIANLMLLSDIVLDRIANLQMKLR